MKKNNKTFLAELKRVKDLILHYQFRFRNGVTRFKQFQYIGLVKKCEDEMSKPKPNEIALGEYYKQLQICD